MKTKKELQEHCSQYINSINLSQCNIWEKRFVNSCKEEDYQFNYYRNVFYKGYDEEKLPFRTIKELISAGANLPSHSSKGLFSAFRTTFETARRILSHERYLSYRCKKRH